MCLRHVTVAARHTHDEHCSKACTTMICLPRILGESSDSSTALVPVATTDSDGQFRAADVAGVRAGVSSRMRPGAAGGDRVCERPVAIQQQCLRSATWFPAYAGLLQ